MGNGRKKYFRHSTSARLDEKIVNLIAMHGKEAYFHYFALLEMCAQKALADDLSGDQTFVFHKRTVCNELMVTPQRLSRHLVAIQSSLLGDLVVTQERVEIKFPNLPKYLGRYTNKNTSKTPNKRKENKRKENTNVYEFSAAPKARSTDIIAAYNQILGMKFQPWKSTNSLIEEKLAPCLEIMPELSQWKAYFSRMATMDFDWYKGKRLNIYLLLNTQRVDEFLNGTYAEMEIEDIFEILLNDARSN